MYVFFDTETTGLKPDRERIVEIAAIKFDAQGNEHDTFQELINPDRPIPVQASDVHGITDDLVKDADRFAAVWDRFIRWLGPWEPGDMGLAYNAEFDLDFLREECRFSMRGLFEHPVSCGYKITQACYPHLVKQRGALKLGNICKAHGIDAGGAHRAMADCRMGKNLFVTLKRKFPFIVKL